MMKSNPLIISCICSCFLLGCAKIGSNNKDNTYLARVDNTYLTLEEAQQAINDFELEQDSITAIEKYREQWIQRQLLLNEARNLKLDQQAEIQEQLKNAREEVLINGLKNTIQAQYKDKSTVTDAEALYYYQQNQNQLVLNERYVKVRLVENSSLAATRRAQQFLRDDSVWVDVALEYSINPQDKISISERFWPASSLFSNLPSMRQYVASLDSGQVSPIQRYQGLYRFIQVTDVRSQGEAAEPEWFIDQLKDWLMNDKQRKYYNNYVKNLYLNAKEDNEIELFNVSTVNLNDNTDSIDTYQQNE